MTLPHRPLGGSGIDVSIMSLGSWRTYERLSRDEGVAVMCAAREAGIDFLDDARYDDETGTAPIPTGWSEVVFGELFRASGWRRDDVTIANKLWWEHWPDEDATAELDGSLGRMGLDHVDLIYAIVPPPTLPVATVVEQVAGLIASGRARAWGTGMWSGEALAAALDVCDATGAPRPVAAQMGCSLAEHRQASDPDDPRRARSRADRPRRRPRPRRRDAERQVPRRPRPTGEGRQGRQPRRAARQGDRGPARRARRRPGAWRRRTSRSRTPSATPTWRASCSARPTPSRCAPTSAPSRRSTRSTPTSAPPSTPSRTGRAPTRRTEHVRRAPLRQGRVGRVRRAGSARLMMPTTLPSGSVTIAYRAPRARRGRSLPVWPAAVSHA